MKEIDLKMWLMGYIAKYYYITEPSKEIADKLNQDADQILTFIKQHYDLKEKVKEEKKEYNEHIYQPEEIKFNIKTDEKET